MNATQTTIPAPWSATDERFFRIVTDLFPPVFHWGASTLLASYDADEPQPGSTAEEPASQVRSAHAVVEGAVRTL